MAQRIASGLPTPLDPDPTKRRFYEQVAQAIRSLEDRFVAIPELANHLQDQGISIGEDAIDALAVNACSIPPVPQGFVVTAGLGMVLLDWDNPYRYCANHGETRVFRGTDDMIANATQIGTSVSSVYVDDTPDDSTDYWYWIRWVTSAATPSVGQPTAAVGVSTPADPEEAFDDIQDEIANDPLGSELNTPTDPLVASDRVERARMRASILLNTLLTGNVQTRVGSVETEQISQAADIASQAADIVAQATDIAALAAQIVGHDLGPETNDFTGDDREAAEAARDAYEETNPEVTFGDETQAWLQHYDDDSSLNIRLEWGVLQVFQRRLDGAWVDNGEPQPTAAAVTSLAADVTSLETTVGGKADATAVEALATKVTTAENDIDSLETAQSSQATDITALQTSVSGKADDSDVTALAGRMTTAESDINTLESTASGQASSIVALEAEIAGEIVPVDILTVQLDSADATAFFGEAVPGASIEIGPSGGEQSRRVYAREQTGDVVTVTLQPGVSWGTGGIEVPIGTDTAATAGTNAATAADVDTAGEWHVEEDVDESAAAAAAAAVNAAAVSSLDTRVTTAETDIDGLETTQASQATDITSLQTSVGDKADASAVSALDTRVTTTENDIDAVESAQISQAAAITALEANIAGEVIPVDVLTVQLDSDDATGLFGQAVPGTSISIGPPGSQQSRNVYDREQTGDVVVLTLQPGVSWGTGSIEVPTGASSTATAATNVSAVADVDASGEWHVAEDVDAGAATAAAVAALDTRVTAAENNITSQATDITALQTSVADKADATALSALETKVTTAENDIDNLETTQSAQATSITNLSAELTQLEADLVSVELGPETNDFTGADRAAAEAERDTYEAANADWLAEYDADDDKNIRLTWGVLYVYQRRVSSAWTDNGAVRAEASAVAQNATAISALDVRVTANEGTLTTQATDITSLQTGLGDKADATALTALETKVTTTENDIDALETTQGSQATSIASLGTVQASQAAAITALEASIAGEIVPVDVLTVQLASADATAFYGEAVPGTSISIGPSGSQQERRVYAREQSGDVVTVTLQPGVAWGADSIVVPTGIGTTATAGTNVSTAADVDTAGEWHVAEDVDESAASATAISALDVRVSSAEADVDAVETAQSAQATSITNLQTSLGDKADTTALDAVATKVTTAEADIDSLEESQTSQASDITALQATVAGLEGGYELGPAANEFTGTSETEATNARDTYAAANADWLAEYDADANKYIVLEYA